MNNVEILKRNKICDSLQKIVDKKEDKIFFDIGYGNYNEKTNLLNIELVIASYAGHIVTELNTELLKDKIKKAAEKLNLQIRKLTLDSLGDGNGVVGKFIAKVV